MNSVAVIESLGNYGCQATFQLFDFGPEVVKVVVELFDFNVHDVVGELLELLLGVLELQIDLVEGLGQGFALGATQHDVLQFGELHNSVGQM